MSLTLEEAGGPMVFGSQIDRRKPVWVALSELWLDTEPTDEDLRRIAKILVDSGYTPSELQDIDLFEVAPVVFTNLLTVSGEWAGFDRA